MKKLIILSLSIIMALTSAMAQNDNKQPRPARNDSARVRINLEQKVKEATERMAKAYDLNEEQTAQVLELNKKVLQARRHGWRKGNRGMQKPQAACPMQKAPEQCPMAKDAKCDKKDGKCDKKDAQCDMKEGKCPMDSAQCKAPKAMRKGHMQGKRPQRRGNFYINALRKIMTPEQFKAYMADRFMNQMLTGDQPRMQSRFGKQRGPRMDMHRRHHQGPRPQHQPQQK